LGTGAHTYVWHGVDDASHRVPDGTYTFSLQTRSDLAGGGIARGVAQRSSRRRHTEVQAAIEIDERVAAPEMTLQLVSRHDLAGAAGEERQDCRGLRRQVHTAPETPKLAGLDVELEDAEPHERHGLES